MMMTVTRALFASWMWTCLFVACAGLAAAEWTEEPIGSATPDQTLSGRWLVFQVTTAETKVPVLGAIETITRSIALHRLEQDGNRLSGPGVLCDLQSDMKPRLVETVYPPALIRALPQPRLDGELLMRNGKLVFHQPKETVVIGAKLENIENEPLPVDPADARVVDQDADGQPGVTVKVRGFVSGDVFVAQRNWAEFWVRQNGSGFAGDLLFETEQRILGATSSRLKTPTAAVPVPSKSYVHMVRLPQDATCRQARAVASTLSR